MPPTSTKKDKRLRFSVSLVHQGDKSFYTLTMPSTVLARTCKVTTRTEDPEKGFQRELDQKRAQEIADYIDKGHGTIPNSIILSAQSEANLKIIGGGKTLEFSDTPGAFLVLDGQHRVWGFALAKTSRRVPVVIYNALSRAEETRLFIDINTKQRPVPPQLLLDIKRLAEIETESEGLLRDIFDQFNQQSQSALKGQLSSYEAARGKITRVTFNSAIKPLLEMLAGRDTSEIFNILNNYIIAIEHFSSKKFPGSVIVKPVIFRAFMGIFPYVAQRVSDKFSGEYIPQNFATILEPLFINLPKSRIESPGTSWVNLRNYLEKRLKSRLTL